MTGELAFFELGSATPSGGAPSTRAVFGGVRHGDSRARGLRTQHDVAAEWQGEGRRGGPTCSYSSTTSRWPLDRVASSVGRWRSMDVEGDEASIARLGRSSSADDQGSPLRAHQPPSALMTRPAVARSLKLDQSARTSVRGCYRVACSSDDAHRGARRKPNLRIPPTVTLKRTLLVEVVDHVIYGWPCIWERSPAARRTSSSRKRLVRTGSCRRGRYLHRVCHIVTSGSGGVASATYRERFPPVHPHQDAGRAAAS